MTTTQTDADLISESLTAPETFAEVFERHGDRVHRYVARRAGPDLAEDLLSETFLTAFEQRARFDPARSPGGALPWLMGGASLELSGLALGSGQTLVIEASFDKNDPRKGTSLGMTVVEGPVAPCQPVDAPLPQPGAGNGADDAGTSLRTGSPQDSGPVVESHQG